jgi:SAM-dependent methyltransferase
LVNDPDKSLSANCGKATGGGQPGSSLSLSVLVPVYNERHLVAASLGHLLQIEHESISRLEVIVVDDCSTDGSYDVVQRIADGDSRVTVLRHGTNRGKGAAIRTALAAATGDVSVVHDADLEYNPGDLPALLRPFLEEGADAVYGSRYLSAAYRRVLMYRHTRNNRWVTALAAWFSDLTVTDIETCYKAIRTPLLKSIPLRSDDFRFEVEITMKLAKRQARIFEVPIRYMPRTQQEGKKIRTRDGMLAVLAILRWWLIDDIYETGTGDGGPSILRDMETAPRFNRWMADALRPHVGDRVLEIGSGIGNLTNHFVPRELYVASDISDMYLAHLRSYSIGKPYLRVARIDAENTADFGSSQGQFDTVLMVNVLEHLPDEQRALGNVLSALAPGGRAVILVPQHPGLFGSLDVALGHQRRYTPSTLTRSLEDAGFRVEGVFDFNRTAAPAWFVNGRLLRRTGFSRFQLKVLEVLLPVIRRIDRLWPWGGQSLVALGVRR